MKPFSNVIAAILLWPSRSGLILLLGTGWILRYLWHMLQDGRAP